MSDSPILPVTGKLQPPGAVPPGYPGGAKLGALPVAPLPLPGVGLDDFLSGAADHRLRDLLAFSMAVEAGRPASPDEVEFYRRKAEADLHAHAFRTLHNQIEAIRLEAAREQLARLHQTPGFAGIVFANIIAMLLVAGGVAAFWWMRAHQMLGI